MSQKFTPEHVEMADELAKTIRSAGQKLKAAMNEGPGGPDCILTPAEATTVYRILTEKMGLRI